MEWKPIRSLLDIKEAVFQSQQNPIMLFKHSTRCAISIMAKSRLERNWSKTENKVQPYYLDLLNFRDVSGYIAEKWLLKHESPQALIISKGELTFHISHEGITVDAIIDSLPHSEIV